MAFTGRSAFCVTDAILSGHGCIVARRRMASRANSHDVSHIAELGKPNMTDQAIFELAASENRIIITFDLDFGEILAVLRAVSSV